MRITTKSYSHLQYKFKKRNNDKETNYHPTTVVERQPPEEKRKDNIQRAREKVTDLCYANVPPTPVKGKSAKFITLTYKDTERAQLYNHDKHVKDFQKFIRGMNKRYGKTNYIAVGELQKKRKALHWHILFFNLPYDKNGEIEKIWGRGFIKVKRIKTGIVQADKATRYVAKYITKENTIVGHDQRSFTCSKGLEQPQVYRNPQNVRIVADIIKNYYIKDYQSKSYPLPRDKGEVIYMSFQYHPTKEKTSG